MKSPKTKAAGRAPARGEGEGEGGGEGEGEGEGKGESEGEAQGAVSVCTGCTAQGLGTLRLDEQLAHRVAERALARYRVRREPRLGLAWFGLGCGFGCGFGFG